MFFYFEEIQNRLYTNWNMLASFVVFTLRGNMTAFIAACTVWIIFVLIFYVVLWLAKPC